VLRITLVDRDIPNGSPAPVTLRLEGRIVGAWVRELARQCDDVWDADRSLRLEMTAVSFVDPDGVRLVRSLIDRGAVVSGCTAFVCDQLGNPDGGHEPPARPPEAGAP